MILAPTVDYIIHTDIDNLGWGAHDVDQTIYGRWSDSEKTLHIKCLELQAIELAIKSFLPPKVLVTVIYQKGLNNSDIIDRLSVVDNYVQIAKNKLCLLK